MIVGRFHMYKCFCEYVKEILIIINTKTNYYNEKLSVAERKLNIHNDIIAKNRTEVFAIYSVNINNLDNEHSKVIICNNINIPKNSDGIELRLKKLDQSYGKHTIFFIKSIIESYFTLKAEIKDIEKNLQVLNSKYLFFDKYKDISKEVFYFLITKCNKFYSDVILSGGTVNFGHYIGFVKVVPKRLKLEKDRPNNRINWDASKKERAKLIKEGKVPYRKADHDEAIKNGEQYNGVPWYVYYTDDIKHYINWYAYSNKLPNRTAYSFFPSAHNNTGTRISEIEKMSKTDIDNFDLGIIHKLNIGLKVNELQFLKYSNNDIQVS